MLRDEVGQTDLVLPASGRCQVRIDVLVSNFEKTMLEDVIEIGP